MIQRFRSGFRRLISHELLRYNFVFFVGTVVISVFNYLFFPVIGRLVSVADFGEIQATIAIFMQLGIILTAYGYVVTNIASNREDEYERSRAILSLERIVLAACTVIFLVLCAVSVLLQSSLQFSSAIPLILVGALILLNVPSTSRAFYLQGLKKLKEVSISGVIFSAGKLIIAVLLVIAFEFDVVMVVVAYIVAQFLTLIYLRWKTGRLQSKSIAYLPMGLLKGELIYGVAIVALLSGITLLYSSDTIVVRLFFNPTDSGLYSGVSAVARIVFFVTASVAGVLIATIKMNDSYSKNLSVLYRSLIIITLIGGLAAVIFVLFPEQFISVLMGSQYASMSQLLPLLALLMLVCSFNNLLVCFEIALRRFNVIYIVALSIIVGWTLIASFHDTLEHIILGYLAANVLVLVLLSIQIVMRKKNV